MGIAAVPRVDGSPELAVTGAGTGGQESHLKDLNLRPSLYKSDALPTELRWRRGKYRGFGRGNHAAAARVRELPRTNACSESGRLLDVSGSCGFGGPGKRTERQISEFRISEGSDVRAGGGRGCENAICLGAFRGPHRSGLVGIAHPAANVCSTGSGQQVPVSHCVKKASMSLPSTPPS